MKNSLMLFVLAGLVPAVGSAHLELKKYFGVNAQGAACTFEVKAITFQNNIKHPLNERVEVVFGERSYFLSHPGQTDVATGQVGFNHDILQAISAMNTGAESITLLMSHEEGKEGPTELVYSRHDWKTNTVEKQSCKLN